MMRSVSVYQDLISHYYLGAFLLRAALPSGVSFKAPIFFASVLSICTVVPAAPDSLFRLLIDPEKCTVEEVEYSGKFAGPNGAYELIGCENIETILTEQSDWLYVDEEGKRQRPMQHAFFTPLFPYEPLLGRALVVGGSGPDGEETPATLTVDAVRSGIQWEQEEKS
ncbi:protein of unknown function [Paraburkholderia dioscoreae]|uniref:DUF3846 domain-containing protein n=2 Tax=Paraburkholderia dioscoreae TaxID=2604047 RepID=A0A5Q4YX60_9BURK|nr:protein of unknown function [Paraburkholderia dioscoreae]